MTLNQQRLLIFKLKHLKGIGNKGLLKLLRYLTDTDQEKQWELSAFLKVGNVKKPYIELFETSFNVAQQMTEEDFSLFLETYGMMTWFDPEYPERLSEIYNPPIALFYQGNLSIIEATKPLAIIGSRKNTDYGKEMIKRLVPPLVAEDVTIVSGLARGNDTYAHKLAIRHQGKTIGVIGSGLDRCYPKENNHLQEYMSTHQLVLSEYLPDAAPLAYHFPARNRIIAGLSKGICVIESNKSSGTAITAHLGLEGGRDIFAVPGNPLKDNSEGCLELIKMGAKCVWKASDILEDL